MYAVFWEHVGSSCELQLAMMLYLQLARLTHKNAKTPLL